jgi:hypothetical protein
MPDRLNELVRQRALVSEHLAWLDREIARANSSQAPAPAPIVAPFASSTSGLPVPAAPVAPTTPVIDPTLSTPSTGPATTPAEAPAALSEEILDQYRVSPKAVHQDVRKGCFLYFAGAFVVLGIVIAILYFTISSR